MTRLASAAALALLVACGTTEPQSADPEATPSAPAPETPSAPNAADESAAGQLLQGAIAAVDAGDVETAKAKMKELQEKYAGTRAFRAGKRVQEEIVVLGKDAVPFEVAKWFQGTAADAEGKATLVVFWETWCPHCKREVPKLQGMHDKYRGQGLAVVGVTKMSRGVTEEQVETFLKDNGVGYPVAHESGTALSAPYAIRGIPAAVVLKDGKVVWRGHPARIKDPMVERWLADS